MNRIKQHTARMLIFALLLGSLSAMPQTAYAAETPVYHKVTMKALPAKAKNTLVSIGKKAASKAVNAIAKECGTEDAAKVASFIDTLLKTDKTKATLKEIDALCKEILAETQQIDADLRDYTTVIEAMLADSAVKEADTNLAAKKREDISNYETDVLELRDTYKTYLDAAVKYAGSQTSANESAYTSAEKRFYNKLCEAYGATGASDDMEELAMTHNTVNQKLESAIYGMASELVRSGNSDYTYADRAAQLAYVSLPWSQDQYEMIDAYISEQIMEITYLLMIYEELLARQGAYMAEHYPDDETFAKNYQIWKEDLDSVNAFFVEKTSAMASQEIIASVSPSVKLTLNEYLRPEDVEGVSTLYCSFYKNPLDYSQTSGKWREFTDTEKDAKSSAVDVKNRMTFQKTGIVENGVSSLYYILTSTLPMSGLDYNNSISGYDQHLPSCDWYNITNSWSDTAESSDWYDVKSASGDIMKLFDTNAFRRNGSKIRSYLSEYVPSSAGDNLYLLTSAYDVDERSWTHTGYPSFDFINADAAQPGSGLDTVTFNGEDIQSGKKYANYQYMVILTRNTGHGWNAGQDVSYLKTEAVGGSLSITNHSYAFPDEWRDDMPSSSSHTECLSGKTCSLKFKPNSGNEVATLSIKRRNNVADSSEVTSEEIILDAGDIAGMTANADGYYEMDLYVPYSDATFSLVCSPSVSETEENSIVGRAYEAGKNQTAGTYRILSADKKTVSFVKPNRKKRIVKIPATVRIEGTTYRVTAIEAGAFRLDRKLKKLTIGKNVRIVGKKAFSGVKKGARVTIQTANKKTFRKVRKRLKNGGLKGAVYTFRKR